MIRRIGFGRPNDRKLVGLVLLELSYLDDRAQMDFIGYVLGLVDEPGIADHRLELENAPFDERLLLFGVFVFRVFAQIAVLFRLANAVVHLAPMDASQLVELLLLSLIHI